MMLHPEISTLVAQEQLRDKFTAIHHQRLVEAYQQPRLVRRLASLTGRFLVHIGAGLVRYGSVTSLQIQHNHHHSIPEVKLP